MKTIATISIATAIMGSVAVLTTEGISLNINTGMNIHNVLQPDLITKHQGWFSTTYNINLGNTLGSADDIQPVITLLETVSSSDTIIFRIKGYGGDVDGLFALENAMKLSKAKIILSVEGNSSSAYAALATSGYELRMSPKAFLMFHMGSIHGLDCQSPEYTTRLFDGIPASESCQNMKDAYTYELEQAFIHNKYLTKREKDILLSGHEVYLTSKEVNKRIQELKHHENIQQE